MNPPSPSHGRNRLSPVQRRVIVATFGLAVLIGCSTETERKWLTTFFDGVPGTGADTNRTAIQYDEDGRPLKMGPVASISDWNLVTIPFTRHPPFEDQKCNACHESKYSVAMKGTQKQVCFGCHENFLTRGTVRHQPVDNGDCIACHAPHGSTNAVMLVEPVRTLCFECHEDNLAKATFKHQPAEKGECSSCHNAHVSTNQFLLVQTRPGLCFDCHRGVLTKTAKHRHAPVAMGECGFCHDAHQSNNKFLLVRKGKSLCFECHDDFLAGAKFKHLAVEDCSACHFSHQSDEPFLLVTNRQQLCYGCHVEEDMIALKGHAGMGTSACVQCHNPHGGDNEYLLKPGVTRPGTIKQAAAPGSARGQ